MVTEHRSPRTLGVAAVQLGPPDGNRASIIARMERQLHTAASQGARIIAFPELALTNYFAGAPYSPDACSTYFQELPDRESEPLFKTADALGLHIIVPFAEWADGRRFNSALVWRAGYGPIGTYRKVHVPQPVEFIAGQANAYESEWFSRGESFPVFELPEARVGVEICYDRHFPESSRCLALAGAEIIFLCSNSPLYGKPWRLEMWRQICSMRAYENTVFFVGANKTGTDGQMDMHGGSCVVSPRGEIIAEVEQGDADACVVARVDLHEIEAERTYRRFLQERRPEAYSRLVVTRETERVG